MTNAEAIHQLEQVAHICTTTALAEACLMGARALETEKTQLSEEGTTFKWIPCSERMPGDKQRVLVQMTNGYIDIINFNAMGLKNHLIAWMPLPAPYKGGDADGREAD